MNRTFFVMGLVACLTLALSACVPAAPPASASNAQAAAGSQVEQFRKFVLEEEQVFQSGDVDRIAGYYADDAISNPPGFPASKGKAAIKADLQTYFDTYSVDRKFDLLGVDVAGDYATRYGEWTQTLTPKAGGDPITETGRCVLGWKKVNGEWKVAWEIWNTYEPVAQTQ